MIRCLILHVLLFSCHLHSKCLGLNAKIITGHLTVSSCTKYLIDELFYGPVVLQIISGMSSILNTFFLFYSECFVCRSFLVWDDDVFVLTVQFSVMKGSIVDTNLENISFEISNCG
jgi:hypothetical protein